eukprot:1087225-Pyramimonas_sp.AAC.1
MAADAARILLEGREPAFPHDTAHSIPSQTKRHGVSGTQARNPYISLLTVLTPYISYLLTNLTPYISHLLDVLNPYISHLLAVLTPYISHLLAVLNPYISHLLAALRDSPGGG